MKKILLLSLVTILSFSAFAFTPDASLKSQKSGKTYYFDFSEKQYARYNSSHAYEGTFDMSNFCSNWDSKIGSLEPTAVFQSPDGSKIYFIDSKNDKYLRHDWDNGSIDAGWPESLSTFDAGWPAEWKGSADYQVTGAFFNNTYGKVYFFDFYHEKYIKYEWDTDVWTATTDMSQFGEYESFDTNLKYANSALYAVDDNFATFYKYSTLSYVEYSWVFDKFLGPYRLTKQKDWSDSWTTDAYDGQCQSYYLQSNQGHRLFPFEVKLPEGDYGADYKLKSANITIKSHSNDSISVGLYPPDNAHNQQIMLFEMGDASGINIGDISTGCPQSAVFSESGGPTITGSTAPYTSQVLLPKEDFDDIGLGATYNGYWYLDVASQAKIQTDYLKRFYLEFEPIEFIQCGDDKTYHAAAGIGTWDMSAFCGTPAGKERVYNFVPEHTGEYKLAVLGGSGYADYYIKNSSMGLNGDNWTCPTSVNLDEYSLGTLTAGDTYYIMVKPEQTTGTSETFRIDCLTCSPPTNLTNNDGSFTSLSFTWDDSPSSTNYSWDIKAAGSMVQTGTTNDPGQFSVVALIPGTEYTFSVKTDCGFGFYSSPVTLVVSTPECQIPTGLVASSITNTSFVVNMNSTTSLTKKWQVVPAGNGMGNGIVAQGEINSTTFNVTGLSPGVAYDFYVQSKCGTTYSDPASLLNISTIVGIEELTNINGLNVYPNPAKNTLNLALNGTQPTTLTVEIIDLLGSIIYQEQIHLNPGHNHKVLDISQLTPSTYFVKLTDQGKTASIRFVKE